jgi:hypothetical protein
MSDGSSDAYQEERAWDAKVKKLRERLSEQDVEMLYYKVREIHDLARDLWTGYEQDFSIRHQIYKPDTDLKDVLAEYLKRIKKIINLPNELPEDCRLYWYSDKPYLKKLEEKKSKK